MVSRPLQCLDGPDWDALFCPLHHAGHENHGDEEQQEGLGPEFQDLPVQVFLDPVRHHYISSAPE